MSLSASSVFVWFGQWRAVKAILPSKGSHGWPLWLPQLEQSKAEKPHLANGSHIWFVYQLLARPSTTESDSIPPRHEMRWDEKDDDGERVHVRRSVRRSRKFHSLTKCQTVKQLFVLLELNTFQCSLHLNLLLHVKQTKLEGLRL